MTPEGPVKFPPQAAVTEQNQGKMLEERRACLQPPGKETSGMLSESVLTAVPSLTCVVGQQSSRGKP